MDAVWGLSVRSKKKVGEETKMETVEIEVVGGIAHIYRILGKVKVIIRDYDCDGGCGEMGKHPHVTEDIGPL